MSEIRATTISDAAGTGPIALTKQSAAKAWVNFNGQNTVAIRDSVNVASITDISSGKYTTNFSSAFVDTNFAVAAYARRNTDNNAATMAMSSNASDTKTTGAFQVKVNYIDNGGGVNLTDPPEVGQHFMGDLA